MGRRQNAEELFEGEYEEEERTRAALSAQPTPATGRRFAAQTPSYDDQFEDRTRSPRESYVVLEGLARSAERARVSFVAPSELEGEQSPAMRARRQSYLDASELEVTPKRPSFAEPASDDDDISTTQRPSYVEPTGRRMKSPRPAASAPAPAPSSRPRRDSFVASSERADFVSSADPDEVTGYLERPQSQPAISQRPQSQPAISQRPSQRPQSQHPVSQRPQPAPAQTSRRPSQHPVSMQQPLPSQRASQRPVSSHDALPSQRPSRRPSQHPVSMQQPVRESTFAPAIESGEIEEVAPQAARPSTRPSAPAPSMPSAEERSRPVDYEALKRFLFDEVPASPEAAAMSSDDRSVSMQTPVNPVRARASNRPEAMRSIRPETAPIAPAAVIGGGREFRPQMMTGPELPPASSLTPVAPLVAPSVDPAARASHVAFRPQMMTGPEMPAQMLPPAFPGMMTTQQSVAPAARASHHAFRPPMMTGPMLPPAQANGPAAQDSYVENSWIVPTPPFPSNVQPIKETGSFKVTFSFIAAAITAVAALAVMIGAIVFIRSEDEPAVKTQAFSTLTPASDVAPAAAKPVDAKPVDAKPVVAAAAPPPAVADTTPAPVAAAPVVAAPVVATPVVAAPVAEKPATDKPATEKPVVAKKTTAKKKAAAVVAQGDDDDDDEPAPAPTKKDPKKATAAEKEAARQLADLQEKQLLR